VSIETGRSKSYRVRLAISFKYESSDLTSASAARVGRSASPRTSDKRNSHEMMISQDGHAVLPVD